MTIETHYANTDLDLACDGPFDALTRELDGPCDVIHYARADDGIWRAIVESSHGADARTRNAALDMREMIDAIRALSPTARAEFDACSLRDFNIGIECGDTWAYAHGLPLDVVRAAADVGCSISLTLYPLRNPDGTPKV